MGLKIIIVGAGIAGLTTAIAVRQAGHSAEIYEKSKFAREIGAALGLTPNGASVLKTLGFSFEKASAREITSWDIADAVSLKILNSQDLRQSSKQFGFQTFAVHRVDMHNELLRLAQEPTEDGKEPVQLHLSSKVVDGNAEEGWIQLENGTKHYADLIVGADGIHSAVRPVVTTAAKARASGLSAFRFLASTKKMKEDPELEALMMWKTSGAATLTNPKDKLPERHMMWYDCQAGEVQNFVGVHYSRDIPQGEDGKPDYKTAMLEEFEAYHPDLKYVLSNIADDVSCWPLMIHEPLPTWTKGRMVLVGDAAHPMLPFGGQGSNQAIEDAGALGRVLEGVKSWTDVPARLRIFEDVRIPRASMIQTLSKVRVGREGDVEEELKKFAPAGAKIPRTFAERSWHAFSHNVIKTIDEALNTAVTVEALPCLAKVRPVSPSTDETQCVDPIKGEELALTDRSLVAMKETTEGSKEDLMRTIQSLTTMNHALIATTQALTTAIETLVATNRALVHEKREDSVESIADQIVKAVASIKTLTASTATNATTTKTTAATAA